MEWESEHWWDVPAAFVIVGGAAFALWLLEVTLIYVCP